MVRHFSKLFCFSYIFVRLSYDFPFLIYILFFETFTNCCACAFQQVLAVFLARRYRNQHDPCYLPARAVFPHNYQY